MNLLFRFFLKVPELMLIGLITSNFQVLSFQVFELRVNKLLKSLYKLAMRTARLYL